MFKRVAGDAMPRYYLPASFTLITPTHPVPPPFLCTDTQQTRLIRGWYKDVVTQPQWFGAEGITGGEGVRFLAGMPEGRPAVAERLRDEELEAVRKGIRAIRSQCSPAERRHHKWMCDNMDVEIEVDPEIRPGELGQRGVMSFEGQTLEIRVLDELPADLWARSRALPPSLEVKDEDVTFPHAVVSNVNAASGQSTRGKAGRALLGGPREKQSRTKRRAGKGKKAAKRGAAKGTQARDSDSASAPASDSAEFSEPDGDSESSSEAVVAPDSDVDERENSLEVRMPTGHVVSQGTVQRGSRVMYFFDLPHGWCTGRVRGPCATNPDCNFDVTYRVGNGTAVYPQSLSDDRQGGSCPGAWVLVENSRRRK